MVNCAAGQASLRPRALLIGRTRPSRPILLCCWLFDCVPWAVEQHRADGGGGEASRLCDRPVRPARMRPDYPGGRPHPVGQRQRRPVREVRPDRDDKGTLLVAIVEPHQISVSPRSAAARRRCVPSITRMVARCTTVGGRASVGRANSEMCSRLAPASLGESPHVTEVIGTQAAGDRSGTGSSADESVP
jgi:hypothetical protein